MRAMRSLLSRRTTSVVAGALVLAHVLAIAPVSAEVVITDFPLLATLLFSNIRSSRPLNRDIASVGVFVASPPPDSATSFAGLSDVSTDAFGMFYRGRSMVGTAAPSVRRIARAARFEALSGEPVLRRFLWRGGIVVALLAIVLFVPLPRRVRAPGMPRAPRSRCAGGLSAAG